MYKYEIILGDQPHKAIGLANKAIEEGWTLGKYPTVRLEDKMPWAFHDQQMRSWNFHVHCLDMLDSLLKAFSETNEMKYLQPTIHVVMDWIENNSDLSHELSPFAWYDMSVGVRAYRLAYLYDAALTTGILSEKNEKAIWNSIEQHQEYLASDNNIVFHNNHGFYQVAGQLAMGRRFAERSALMAEAYEQGQARLKTMLHSQFAEDGIHREHSPDYHRMVYDTLKAMIDSGLVSDIETIEFAKRIEEALSWFVLPDQHIVNFGDSDYRLMSRKPAEAQRKWQTSPMQFVVSNGQVGSLPSNSLQIFPIGGYAVVRQPDSTRPEEFKHFSYLAQIAAFHSRTHKHADDLSFIWSDRGSNILVDAGRYGYLGKAEQGSDLWLDGYWYSDPKRVYVETTQAHNTLEFDDKNYKRKGAKPYGSALKRSCENENGIFAIETEVKQLGSIRHARVLIYLPAKWLVVFDCFHDNNGASHNIKQWFHFSPELSVLPIGNDFMVPIVSSIQPLCIVSLLKGQKASRLHIAEDDIMQGWWSPKERELVPNYALNYQFDNVSSGAFATLFSFSNELKNDIEWSKVNASGRKAQFRWKDENGRHVLMIERPNDGDLIINYEAPSK